MTRPTDPRCAAGGCPVAGDSALLRCPGLCALAWSGPDGLAQSRTMAILDLHARTQAAHGWGTAPTTGTTTGTLRPPAALPPTPMQDVPALRDWYAALPEAVRRGAAECPHKRTESIALCCGAEGPGDVCRGPGHPGEHVQVATCAKCVQDGRDGRDTITIGA